MADKAVSELVAAEQITASDLFVLEQSGTAKKLTGQILLNWLTKAADGHGGISSIEKTSTSGLADTYRITLADTTTFDFVVTNGRSVNSIKKTSTSGLVDTYTITYNDGTSDTFAVTNGAKGDTGAASYVWIKYASQEPTEDSHSFGDLPDDWMGIYSGTASTAPDDWTQYQWFEIKGKQGDTGSPATLTGSAVEYLTSDSGTVVPSGSWTTSIPAVAQGKYLWTRITHTFNTGDPIVAYSVCRMGLDGLGSVASVNQVSPDENGNVQLTPENIGALSAAGGSMSGWLNFTGTTVGLKWKTEDGTEFRVRSYTSGNLFQVTVVTAAGTEAAAFNVKNDGSVWLGKPLGLTSGGFGGTTAAQARSNLGITPANIGAIPNTGGKVSGDITFEAGESETNGINFARPTNYKYEAHMDVLNNRLRIYRYDTAGTYMEVFSVSLADGEVILGGDMYVNPDMTMGTEYKLAEYYDGSPVYAKWVDFGALPNNTYKSLSIGVAPAKMVSISGILYDTGNVSFVPFGAACDIATCFVNSANYLVVETTSDRTAWTGKFLLKYTK